MPYGKLKKEIEIKNGKLEGIGKEYDDKGNLMFVGEYLIEKK